MILPMKIYNKEGKLVKTVSSETLSKKFWEMFWKFEKPDFNNKRKK